MASKSATKRIDKDSLERRLRSALKYVKRIISGKEKPKTLDKALNELK